jgi:hypothetical protein
MGNAKRCKRIGGVCHDRPVGLTSHDDGNVTFAGFSHVIMPSRCPMSDWPRLPGSGKARDYMNNA